MPFEQFDQMLQINLYGYTAYGTSKFAVLGFAQCLRYELKPRGIDVLCFSPAKSPPPGWPPNVRPPIRPPRR